MECARAIGGGGGGSASVAGRWPVVVELCPPRLGELGRLAKLGDEGTGARPMAPDGASLHPQCYSPHAPAPVFTGPQACPPRSSGR